MSYIKYYDHFMFKRTAHRNSTKDTLISELAPSISVENKELIIEHYKQTQKSTILSEGEEEHLAQLEIIALSKSSEYVAGEGLNYLQRDYLETEMKMSREEARASASITHPKTDWCITLCSADKSFLSEISKKLPIPYSKWFSDIDFIRWDSLLEVIMVIRSKTERRILFEVT
jgi:hypothetical protein